MRHNLLLLVVMLVTILPTTAATAHAATPGLPAEWTKGFNYTAWWHDGYSTTKAQASLDALVTTGANAISLFPSWYMATGSSSTIAPDTQRTPSDQSLATAVARAKAKGLKVMLRPAIDPLDGTSRLYLAPSSPSAWFESYRTMIRHYADLATRLGVDSLQIGLEYQSMTVPAYESYWRSIIADVRQRFSGTITYGATMKEYRAITWWDALDVIGIDAYFQLSNGATPSEDQIVANWSSFTDSWGRTHRYIDEIAAVQARFGKPVIFTEIGYRSALNALQDPWNRGGTYSAVDQQMALAAAFRAFADKPWFRGVYLWHWYAQDPAAGGLGDTDHTPQNKPAQKTVTEWFTGSIPSAPQPVAPAPEPVAPERSKPRRGDKRGPSKLSISRASVESSQGMLDVLAPISAQADGEVTVELHAAAERTQFKASIDPQKRRVRFAREIPHNQAKMGTGILTLTYPGNDVTRPEELRLRAAPIRARLDAGRPELRDGRLRAKGRISTKARGVVRVSISYVHNGRVYNIARDAKIRKGRYGLNARLSREDVARVTRRTGTVHSTIQYTGYLPEQMGGQTKSLRVLPAR